MPRIEEKHEGNRGIWGPAAPPDKSPLAGLKRPKPLPPPLPPIRWLSAEEQEARGLARRVLALAELLSTEGVKLQEDHGRPDIVWLDLGDPRPPASYGVSPTGTVLKYTCEWDAAGAPYCELTEDIPLLRAREELVRLNAELERRAVAAEERRLEEAARRRRHEAARANLDARLRSKGVFK